MKILDLAKGKKVNVKTDVGAYVILEIKEIIAIPHSKELGPSTRENDWWPPTQTWTTYDVVFTNGHKKTYNSLGEIELL